MHVFWRSSDWRWVMLLQNFCTNSVPSRVWPMRGENHAFSESTEKNFSSLHEIKMGPVYLIHVPGLIWMMNGAHYFKLYQNAETFCGVIFLYSWYHKSLAFQRLPSEQQIPFWYVSLFSITRLTEFLSEICQITAVEHCFLSFFEHWLYWSFILIFDVVWNYGSILS